MMPAGEELDAAVAKAMGWTHLIPGPDWQCPEILHWLRPDGSFKGSLPAFSTDAANIPEMLAWLNERGWRVELVQPWSLQGFSCRAENGSARTASQSALGDTIQHALANLIVQVAERKEPTP